MIGRRSDYDAQKRESVRRLYVEKGMTDSEIGTALGMSRGRVSQIRRDAGIIARSRSRRVLEAVELLKFAAEEGVFTGRFPDEDYDLEELVKRFYRERRFAGKRAPKEEAVEFQQPEPEPQEPLPEESEDVDGEDQPEKEPAQG